MAETDDRMLDTLTRIANALERLAPPAAPKTTITQPTPSSGMRMMAAWYRWRMSAGSRSSC